MKIKINKRRKTGKSTNIWKLHNILLNKQQVKEEIMMETGKYFKTNGKEI